MNVNKFKIKINILNKDYFLLYNLNTLTLLTLSPNGLLLLITGVGLFRNFESTGSTDFFSIKTVI